MLLGMCLRCFVSPLELCSYYITVLNSVILSYTTSPSLWKTPQGHICDLILCLPSAPNSAWHEYLLSLNYQMDLEVHVNLQME